RSGGRLLSRHEYSGWIKRLPNYLFGDDAEIAGFDQLGDSLLDLSSPKCRRHFAQHFIDPVEDRRILADHHERQPAPRTQHAMELVHRAYDVLGRQQLE